MPSCACAALCCPAPRRTQNDSVLYTASGDQHVGVWDTAAGRLKVYCAGHDGSVKVVTPHTSSQDILASGNDDGGLYCCWGNARVTCNTRSGGDVNLPEGRLGGAHLAPICELLQEAQTTLLHPLSIPRTPHVLP